MKANHLLLAPLCSNVIFHFSDKPKPLRIGPYKILDRLSDVTYELLAQDGSTLHVQRNHLRPYYPKDPPLYPHIRHFSASLTQFTMISMFQNPLNMLIATHHLLISMNPSLTILIHQMTKTLHQMTSFKTHPPSNTTSPFKQILRAPDNNQFSDRTRHPSQNQSTLLMLQIVEIPKLNIT